MEARLPFLAERAARPRHAFSVIECHLIFSSGTGLENPGDDSDRRRRDGSKQALVGSGATAEGRTVGPFQLLSGRQPTGTGCATPVRRPCLIGGPATPSDTLSWPGRGIVFRSQTNWLEGGDPVQSEHSGHTKCTMPSRDLL